MKFEISKALVESVTEFAPDGMVSRIVVSPNPSV